MSFIETMPSSYRSLIVQRNNTYDELSEIEFDLGDGDYGFHECDCEYCPVPELPDLSPADRAEKEEQQEKLQETLEDYEHTIKSLEGYGKLVGVELKKEIKGGKYLVNGKLVTDSKDSKDSLKHTPGSPLLQEGE